MFLTYERKEMAWSTLEHNLLNAGSTDYELMICDQGTTDQQYLNEMDRVFKPTYFRRNIWNEGVARSLNQLMLRRKRPHAMFMPNDIVLEKDWLKVAIEYLADINPSGVVGWEDSVGLKMPRTTIKGVSGKEWDVFCEKDFVLDGSQVMGATIFPESLIETVGYLEEDFGLYGWEDQGICFRAKIAGLHNYYIPNIKATHLGTETGTDYKEQKEKHLHNSVGYFRHKVQNYHRYGIYVPQPMKIEAYSI